MDDRVWILLSCADGRCLFEVSMDFYTLSTRPRRADGVLQLRVLASWKSVAHRYTALSILLSYAPPARRQLSAIGSWCWLQLSFVSTPT